MRRYWSSLVALLGAAALTDDSSMSSPLVAAQMIHTAAATSSPRGTDPRPTRSTQRTLLAPMTVHQNVPGDKVGTAAEERVFLHLRVRIGVSCDGLAPTLRNLSESVEGRRFVCC